MQQLIIENLLIGFWLGEALGRPLVAQNAYVIRRQLNSLLSSIADPGPHPETRLGLGISGTIDDIQDIAHTENRHGLLCGVLAAHLLDADKTAPTGWRLAYRRFCSGEVSTESAGGVTGFDGLGLALPLAVIWFDQPDVLRQISYETASDFYSAPASIGAMTATACLMALILAEANPETILAHLLKFVDGINDDLEQVLLRVGHVVGLTSDQYASNHIGKGSRPEEIVAIAVLSLLRYPNDYLRAVGMAVSIDGDSGAAGALTSALMLVRKGLESIPSDWHYSLLQISELVQPAVRNLNRIRQGN